ncbi:MAG: CCA tRNA nucleotidyltransferase [Roseburia sp.]|nr:CCA tRNA nucleotidyltransferase [Roseburia sp.]
MKMILPAKVNFIIDTLQKHGFEGYAVGGCVRDAMLSRVPQDWDITTSAKPEQVKALFKHTIDTGIQHGTVTVMLEHEGFEVTTYRIDGEYEDARHPKEVQFTSNLLEDLRRRDFTINAMAYNEKDGLVDAFDGVGDLERGIIRCVGVAEERFTEDALRMLRAVRFAAQLGFEIEGKTKDAIAKLAPNLAKVSAERIQIELIKLLTSTHPEEIKTAWETGLTNVFLPEFDAMMVTEQENPHHMYSVGEHAIVGLKNVPADKVLRLTMLLHDIAKPLCKTTDEDGIDHFYGHVEKGEELARKILRRLKFDNDTTTRVCRLVACHDHMPELTAKSVRRAIFKNGEEQYPALFEIKRADMLAQSDYMRQEKIEKLKRYHELYDEIIEKQQCLSIKDLAINGADLIALGMKPGKELGEVLKKLLDMVLEEPQLNTKEKLIEQVHNLETPFI